MSGSTQGVPERTLCEPFETYHDQVVAAITWARYFLIRGTVSVSRPEMQSVADAIVKYIESVREPSLTLMGVLKEVHTDDVVLEALSTADKSMTTLLATFTARSQEAPAALLINSGPVTLVVVGCGNRGGYFLIDAARGVFLNTNGPQFTAQAYIEQHYKDTFSLAHCNAASVAVRAVPGVKNPPPVSLRVVATGHPAPAEPEKEKAEPEVPSSPLPEPESESKTRGTKRKAPKAPSLTEAQDDESLAESSSGKSSGKKKSKRSKRATK